MPKTAPQNGNTVQDKACTSPQNHGKTLLNDILPS